MPPTPSSVQSVEIRVPSVQSVEIRVVRFPPTGKPAQAGFATVGEANHQIGQLPASPCITRDGELCPYSLPARRGILTGLSPPIIDVPHYGSKNQSNLYSPKPRHCTNGIFPKVCQRRTNHSPSVESGMK